MQAFHPHNFVLKIVFCYSDYAILLIIYKGNVNIKKK